jgi:hypothetical protein
MDKQWMHKLVKTQLVVSVLSAALLTACGGGGAAGGLGAILSGVVAVGAPVPLAKVVIKDANGKSAETTADQDGNYSFTADRLDALSGALMIQATGTVGGTPVILHSLLESTPKAGAAAQVLNVNPATEAITSQALTADPATTFNANKVPANVNADQLAQAKSRLKDALKDVLLALGQDPAQVDLMTTKFKADNTGIDKMFDLVSIQTNAQSATARDVVVAEKKDGGASVTISSSSSAAVTPLPKPTQAELSLDTAKIKDFIAAFNTLVMTQEGIKSAEMKDMFDENFLDNGMTRQNLLDDLLANAVGQVQLSSLLINGCSSDANGDICKGQMTVKNRDTQEDETMPMSFKYGSDKKWRAYGNRSPFDFELKPVVTDNSAYANGSDASPSRTTQWGINFWFPTVKVKDSSGVYKLKYQSAKLLSSNDAGKTWTLVMTLKVPGTGSKCPSDNNFLPIDGGAISCTNFMSVMDETKIAASNAALASGSKQFQIQAFASADASGEPTDQFVTYSKKRLFNAVTGPQALTDAAATMTSALNQSSVSFSAGGGVLEHVSIGVSPTSGVSSLNTSSWNNPWRTKALNGQASVAKALELCLSGKNLTETDKSNCNAAYGSSAIIKRLQLSARDSMGRGVWRSYYLNGTF